MAWRAFCFICLVYREINSLLPTCLNCKVKTIRVPSLDLYTMSEHLHEDALYTFGCDSLF